MKRWYVVQVFAGYEQAVKKDLEKHIVDNEMQDRFADVMVPSVQMAKFFDISDKKDQQLFPGYILVEMEMAPETMRLVAKTNRVIRFLGGMDPPPLRPSEVKRIVSQVKGEVKVRTQEVSFIEGSEVEIKDGPFSGFVGIIERVDAEGERLTIMVSIFGRMTPVELGFHQVKQ